MVSNKKIFERIGKFFEEKKVERKDFMIEKGYIDSSVPYSDELWLKFKEKWQKDFLKKNK